MLNRFSFTYFWNIHDYSKPCPPNPIKRAKIERKKHYDLLRKKYAEFFVVVLYAVKHIGKSCLFRLNGLSLQKKHGHRGLH